MDDRAQPHLFPAFLDEVKEDWKRGGFFRVVPWVALASIGAGVAVARFAPASLFTEANWATLTALYAGVLTFNGITLALTWSAVGKIYETVSRGDFARFLRASGTLGTYTFYIHFMHVVQVTAAVTALLALFATFVQIEGVDLLRPAIGAVLATTLYAVKWAAGSVRIVRDLAWHSSTFDNLSDEEKKRVWLAADGGLARP